MLLGFFTVVVMAIVAYTYWREDALTAVTMCVNVFVAGLIAFNFFEPIADVLDPIFAGTILAGYEDSLCLVALFSATLGFLRWATNSLAATDLEYPPLVHRGVCVLFGLLTGYLVSGFLLCVVQTLPLPETFLTFSARYDPSQPGAPLRRVLPPDRVWLGLMHRAGAYAFANRADATAINPISPYEKYYTFDREGSFEARYARHRRYDVKTGNPRPYQGEFDQELQGPMN